ncbi:MAG: hypothetical protein ABIH23_23900 [bacterium]
MREGGRPSGPDSDEKRQTIPQRSFGNCRWCATTDVRLQYLMCTKCFWVADMVPSKVSVLLSRPEIKKRLREAGPTIKNVVPELRTFVLDPKMRFPPDLSSHQHWDRMLTQCAKVISDADLHKESVDLKNQSLEIPPRQELRAKIGLERLLYFILKVAVLCKKIDLKGDEEGFCVVCWKPTPTEKHMLCTQCRSDLIREVQIDEKPEDTEPKVYKGMATRDIVLKDRRR